MHTISNTLGPKTDIYVYRQRERCMGEAQAPQRKPAAIKSLHIADNEIAERFWLEAARCNHENIITIHRAHGQTVPYMMHDYLEDRRLSNFVGQERIPSTRAVQLMMHVIEAYAHAQNIVHRDLKPTNIFVTDNGNVKVLDFNPWSVPSIVEFSAGTDQELTGHGSLVGTLPYMSPEQWGVDTINHCIDIWTLGIIPYRMVGTVEIVHEVLMHSWPTLVHWLDENQKDAVSLEWLRAVYHPFHRSHDFLDIGWGWGPFSFDAAVSDVSRGRGVVSPGTTVVNVHEFMIHVRPTPTRRLINNQKDITPLGQPGRVTKQCNTRADPRSFL